MCIPCARNHTITNAGWDAATSALTDKSLSLAENGKYRSPASFSTSADPGEVSEKGGLRDPPFFSFRLSKEWKFPSCDRGQHPQCRVS